MLVCAGIVAGFMAATAAPMAAADTCVLIEGVPWYQQTNAMGCGPASLQMIFDFYGQHIDQREIVFATGTEPSAGIGLPGMVKGGHFSDLSVIDLPNCKIVGYTDRGLGYAAFSVSLDEFWLDGLKALIDMGYPVIVNQWFGYETMGNSNTVPASLPIGHYRIVVGYDDATREVIVQDPWGRDYKQESDFQGTMSDQPGYDPDFEGLRFDYDYFQLIWSRNFQVPYRAIFVAPWHVDINTVVSGMNLEVTATVTYPCPAPFGSSQYPASDVQVQITLPAGLELAEGETATKTVVAGLSAGGTIEVTWDIVASSAGSYEVSVLAQGIVSDLVDDIPYTDRIGGDATASIAVAS